MDLVLDLVLEILLLFPLIVMIFQDFKTRTIVWWSVFVFLILAIGIHYDYFNGFHFQTIGSNLLFFTIQLACLWLYLSIKNKQLINLTQKYLGIGDILFFIPICFLFSLINLIVYLVISLVIFLILGLLFFYISKSDETNDPTIPLAGGLSSTLFITRLINHFTNFNVFDDTFFILKLL